MPHHVACYQGTVGQTVDTDIAAATDGILTIQNSHFVLNHGYNIVGAWAGSTTLLRARISSPTLRQVFNPYLRPVDQAIVPPTNPNVMLLHDYPLAVPPWEEIQFLATSGLACGTEQADAVLLLQNGFVPWPQKRIYPARITSTTAAVAHAWTQITPTWQDTIPQGQYALVYSEHFSATGIAHRFTLSGQYERPGQLSAAANKNSSPPSWRDGALGTYGTFRSNDLPRIEVFCNAADSSHELYAWLMYMGSLS